MRASHWWESGETKRLGQDRINLSWILAPQLPRLYTRGAMRTSLQIQLNAAARRRKMREKTKKTQPPEETADAKKLLVRGRICPNLTKISAYGSQIGVASTPMIVSYVDPRTAINTGRSSIESSPSPTQVPFGPCLGSTTCSRHARGEGGAAPLPRPLDCRASLGGVV